MKKKSFVQEENFLFFVFPMENENFMKFYMFGNFLHFLLARFLQWKIIRKNYANNQHKFEIL